MSSLCHATHKVKSDDAVPTSRRDAVDEEVVRHARHTITFGLLVNFVVELVLSKLSVFHHGSKVTNMDGVDSTSRKIHSCGASTGISLISRSTDDLLYIDVGSKYL